jgi:hypothetical protein
MQKKLIALLTVTVALTAAADPRSENQAQKALHGRHGGDLDKNSLSVPDAGSTLVLTAIGAACLGVCALFFKRKRGESGLHNGV